MKGDVNIFNFVAIDFETAYGKNACQLGIAVVENSEIVERHCLLIRPKGNAYHPMTIKVHGITPSMTRDCPSFPDVWEKVKHLFDKAIVVAHNAPFDIAVLFYNLDIYNIERPNISAVIDTCCMNEHLPLDKVCRMYGVKLDKHHDALCDAVACAEVLIRMSGKMEIEKAEETEPREPSIRHLEIDGEKVKIHVHKPINVDCDSIERDENGPMCGMYVLITGEFWQERDEIAARAYEKGATILKGFTKKLNCMIVGSNPGPSKMKRLEALKEQGHLITIFNQKEVNDILFPESNH